ncbi:O-methyltransferase [Leadbetterella sp. DM7]|uniref:O-methyltransferase n=1 Tax=Leadbetterella sp. DM7 TaxID=3235085 RepID=UPI00349E4F2E
MNITDPRAEEYCLAHTGPEPDVLAAVNRDTHANLLKPRMLSGHFQGRLLSLISRLVRPRNILEIGTFTGYSALCLAEGLQPGGRLYTLEADEELEDRIRRNIEMAGKTADIELIIGPALEIIPRLDINFDLVFIDADKLNYLNYYKLIIDKVNVGGVILSDNVLWSGKITDETKNDATTQLLREFNDYLAQDNRTEKVLLPVRDGLFVSLKIK